MKAACERTVWPASMVSTRPPGGRPRGSGWNPGTSLVFAPASPPGGHRGVLMGGGRQQAGDLPVRSGRAAQGLAVDGERLAQSGTHPSGPRCSPSRPGAPGRHWRSSR